MPRTIKLTRREWEIFIDLISSGAAKSYICQYFGITSGEFKKIKRQLFNQISKRKK